MQCIILSHWQREPQDYLSPGSSSRIHPSAAVLTGPAAEMVAAMGLDETLNLLKGLGTSQSSLLEHSDCGEVENQECRNAVSFLFMQLKIQHSWILACLKKWYTVFMNFMYVITLCHPVCFENPSFQQHINNLNSAHSYFCPNTFLDPQRSLQITVSCYFSFLIEVYSS